MTNPGTISIGTSDKQHVVVTMSDGGNSTMHTMMPSSLARIYGAMLVALADELDAAASLGMGDGG